MSNNTQYASKPRFCHQMLTHNRVVALVASIHNALICRAAFEEFRVAYQDSKRFTQDSKRFAPLQEQCGLCGDHLECCNCWKEYGL